METNKLPLVSIQCLVYNHEPYLRQCLDGFVMQRTNFKFEAIVHDDVSTDGSAAIIREYAEKYPDIIKPIFEIENQYSKHDGSLDRIMRDACKGKYIALCEGDDYWIDPLKLQKQFEYMESYPECSLLHTSFQFYTQHDGMFHDSKIDQEAYELNQRENRNIACEILDFKYRVVTATSFFKYETYNKLINDEYYNRYKFMLGDIQLWAMLLQSGRIGYLPDVTAVYRVHADSACRQVDMKCDARMCLSISEMQLHFLPKVRGGERLKDKFSAQFRKNLFKYRLFEPQYISFISDNDCKLNILVSILLKFSLIRSLMVQCLKYKRLVFKNSPVKVKSIE